MAEAATNIEASPGFRLRSLTLPLYLPSILIGIGQGAVIPVIPLFAEDLRAGVALVGVVVAMRGTGTMLFNVPSGVSVSRFGDQRTMLLGTFGLGAVAFAAGLSGSVLQLALAVLLMGVGWSLWDISRLAYGTTATPVPYRGRVFSILGGTTRIGHFIGPIIGGLFASIFGLEAAFFLQAALAIGAGLLIAAKVRNSERVAALGGGSIYRTLGRTLLDHRHSFLVAGMVMLVLQVLRNARQVIIPLWGAAIGLDVAEIGLVFGLSSAIDILMFYPTGMLMDRRGRKWTCVPALLILSAGIGLVPLTDGFMTLLAAGLLGGFGNGLSAGIVMTLGADLAPERNRGEFLGVWRMFGDTGVATGPMIIGLLAGVATMGVAALATAGIGVIGAGVLAFLVGETLHERTPARPPARTAPAEE